MSKQWEILLVDDHVIVRQGIAQMLQCEADFKIVGEAGNSADALQLLRTECVDVVILDLVLGKESGLELLKRIADEFPLVAVLVLSMHEDRLYAERVIRAGARGYITKSEATETLVGAIRGAVAGRLHLSDTMKMRVIQRIATPGKTDASPIDGLSDRELEVLRLIASGKSNAQIAIIINRSVKTVEAHKSTLKTKLNVQSATELMRAALQYLEPT